MGCLQKRGTGERRKGQFSTKTEDFSTRKKNFEGAEEITFWLLSTEKD